VEERRFKLVFINEGDIVSSTGDKRIGVSPILTKE